MGPVLLPTSKGSKDTALWDCLAEEEKLMNMSFYSHEQRIYEMQHA
jgi:hypothetical protein